MGKPHVHAELIKAWADGAEIEFLDAYGHWSSIGLNPRWMDGVNYRIKPEPKPDVVERYWVERPSVYLSNPKAIHNLKLTFDGETGKLKSAEVL